MAKPNSTYTVSVCTATIVTTMNPTLLAKYWNGLAIQCTPFNSVISMCGDTFRALDEGAARFIGMQYMELNKCPIMFVRDGTHVDRYFLGPTSLFISGKLIPDAANKNVPVFLPAQPVAPELHDNNGEEPAQEKLPRPPNAYILYRRDRHRGIKDAHPGITNNQISVILGKKWHNEPASVRSHYKRMATNIKEEFMRQNPGYQYRPRRPDEKKRRAKHANVGKARTFTVPMSTKDQQDLQAAQNVATAGVSNTMGHNGHLTGNLVHANMGIAGMPSSANPDSVTADLAHRVTQGLDLSANDDM